jgi:hypothetical protein
MCIVAADTHAPVFPADSTPSHACSLFFEPRIAIRTIDESFLGADRLHRRLIHPDHLRGVRDRYPRVLDPALHDDLFDVAPIPHQHQLVPGVQKPERIDAALDDRVGRVVAAHDVHRQTHALSPSSRRSPASER